VNEREGVFLFFSLTLLLFQHPIAIPLVCQKIADICLDLGRLYVSEKVIKCRNLFFSLTIFSVLYQQEAYQLDFVELLVNGFSTNKNINAGAEQVMHVFTPAVVLKQGDQEGAEKYLLMIETLSKHSNSAISPNIDMAVSQRFEQQHIRQVLFLCSSASVVCSSYFI
jgi:hypothetical protein